VRTSYDSFRAAIVRLAPPRGVETDPFHVVFDSYSVPGFRCVSEPIVRHP
jgi:hypothetical protein